MAKAKKKTVKKVSSKKPTKKPAKKAAQAKVAKKTASKPLPAKKLVKAPALQKALALTPLDDRLVVQVQAGERVTAGGLIIPDTAETSGNYRGVVLSAGRGHRSPKGKVKPMDVRKGDWVLFSEHSGSKLQLDGQEVRILRESEVLGIVENP